MLDVQELSYNEKNQMLNPMGILILTRNYLILREFSTATGQVPLNEMGGHTYEYQHVHPQSWSKPATLV